MKGQRTRGDQDQPEDDKRAGHLITSSLGSPAVTNFKQQQTNFTRPLCGQLAIGFRLIEQLRLHWRWSFRKSQGLWTGDLNLSSTG